MTQGLPRSPGEGGSTLPKEPPARREHPSQPRGRSRGKGSPIAGISPQSGTAEDLGRRAALIPEGRGSSRFSSIRRPKGNPGKDALPFCSLKEIGGDRRFFL